MPGRLRACSRSTSAWARLVWARVSLPERHVKAAVGPGALELGRQGLSPSQLDGLISRLKPRPTERHGMPTGSRHYEMSGLASEKRPLRHEAIGSKLDWRWRREVQTRHRKCLFNRDLHGHLLMQQPFGGRDHGYGMEALVHRRRSQQVRDR